jgi:hypothetical protein
MERKERERRGCSRLGKLEGRKEKHESYNRNKNKTE